MKLLASRFGNLYALCAATCISLCTLGSDASAQEPLPRDHVRATQGIASLTGFVENKGQWDEGVLFHARSGAIGATLWRDALVLRPLPPLEREVGEDGLPVGPADTRAPVVLRFPAAAAAVEGEGALPTKHHFFVGERRATNVLGYGSVLYRDLVPGVSLRVRIDAQRNFAYDLLAEPGAALERFEIAVEGAQELELREPGLLVLSTPFGPLEQRIGPTWQEHLATGARMELAAHFFAGPRGAPGELRYGLQAPSWDPSQRLVIDPGLWFATYVGGSGQDLPRRMEVAPNGAVYVLMHAATNVIPPTTSGTFNPFKNPIGSDAWVGKVSPGGTNLEWATFVGGTHTDQATGFALAPEGALVFGGHTWSTDYPTTPGALQEMHAGVPGPPNGHSSTPDLYIARLSALGDQLEWATLFGNTVASETSSALTLLPSGNVVLAGQISGSGVPMQGTPGALDPEYELGEQQLLCVSADGSTKLFHTYFKADRILDMTSDASSNIYFCGDAGPDDGPLPTTPGVLQAQVHPGLGKDAYVAKLDSSGSFLHWATYFGGSEGYDSAWAIAVDAAGAVYLGGQTDSDDFPTSSGALMQSPGPNATAGFCAKLLPDASDLAWSTYMDSCCVAGSGSIYDVAIDAAGGVHAVGASNVGGWPVTPNAFQPNFIGPTPHGDIYAAKLNPFGEKLDYGTWFGGIGNDSDTMVGLDANGRPHVVFMSTTASLPGMANAHDSTHNGSGDLVVCAFDLPQAPWRVMAGALEGASSPVLAGAGTLLAGRPTRLSARGAPPGAPAWGVAGFSQMNLPLFGGFVLPAPELVVPLHANNQGGIDLNFLWPQLVPGAELYFQVWMLDLAAPQLFSATNAMKAISQ